MGLNLSFCGKLDPVMEKEEKSEKNGTNQLLSTVRNKPVDRFFIDTARSIRLDFKRCNGLVSIGDLHSVRLKPLFHPQTRYKMFEAWNMQSNVRTLKGYEEIRRSVSSP